jgi:hypothetical protein
MSLRLDWCSHEAAKFAVERWHYSRSLPAGKVTRLGAWESEKFIGCVLFSRGANRNMAGEFGLQCTECAELSRVALSDHDAPVSRVVSVAIRKLRHLSPGLRLLISYADPAQNHHGGIYQAMGWTYIGTSRPQSAVVGMHKRSATSRYGTIQGLPRTVVAFKHKYLYPLDAEMRARIAPLAKPYPKRARSIDSDAPGFQSGEGGAIPTRALQTTEVLDGAG